MARRRVGPVRLDFRPPEAVAIAEAARRRPKTFGTLLEQMDRTRRVDRVYRRVRALLQTEAIIAAPPSVADIRRCSAQHLLSSLSSLSGLDPIVTDPPYLKDCLPLYTELARLASKVLKPTGLLAIVCPHIHLPDILASLTPHIPYRWTIAYITPGSTANNW